MYPTEIVIPFKKELTLNGFEDLSTTEKMENFLQKKGSSIIVINSICGCAAGSCRPGVLLAYQQIAKKPDNLGTCFAGYDIDAVATIRQKLLPYPPSSPAIAFFKDGKAVHLVERYQIEGSSANQLAQHLVNIMEQFF